MRESVLNKSISALVLVIQVTVVLIMSIFLSRVNLVSLDTKDMRKKVGNMYLGLNTRK